MNGPTAYDRALTADGTTVPLPPGATDTEPIAPCDLLVGDTVYDVNARRHTLTEVDRYRGGRLVRTTRADGHVDYWTTGDTVAIIPKDPIT